MSVLSSVVFGTAVTLCAAVLGLLLLFYLLFSDGPVIRTDNSVVVERDSEED